MGQTVPVSHVRVTGAERITPRTARVTFTGDALPHLMEDRPGPDLDGVDVAWVAGEASAVRALRRHLVEERRLPKGAVEFSGYWRRALTQDDAPTEEDLAWAAERAADPA